VAVFVVRRLVISFFILLVSTFIIFTLVTFAGDPLGDLRLDTSPNRADKIAHRTQMLHLDESIPHRYASWLGGIGKCVVPGAGCDFGQTIRDQDVSSLLSLAAASTLRLVTAATVVAIVLGVGVGIVSALRQYSGFDYTLTFSVFLFFSLPIFWLAVLLKQYVAIDFNNWYDDPRIGVVTALVLAAISGLTWGAILGGSARRRWVVRGVAAAGSFVMLEYLSSVQWFKYPALGPVLITLFSVGAAFGVAALTAGLNRRNVVYACLCTAGVGVLAQFAVIPWIQNPKWASWTNLLLLAVVSVLVAAGIGYGFGGLDRAQSIRACVLTALAVGSLIFIDVALRAVPGYANLVNGRIFATTGSETPNFDGTFWQAFLDQVTHLVLPTLSIMLISFATYSRYSRASMLETMNADYVRTARSKGLTERTVVMRHAFRNALIPVTTLMAYDFGNLIGGAVITETVFARRGMGQLFVQGLLQVDPNPVLGFYIVTAVSIVVFNMVSDIAYAYLDPRIRLA
jgi:peptide/nickel transport system permease protein